MPDTIVITSPLGPLHLRPEGADDAAFRFRLFCDSRLPEWYGVQIEPTLRQHLMLHQFHAQTTSYLHQFPQARFDIVLFEGQPIGRMVVDRPGTMVHLVDVAIVPAFRCRGFGTALIEALKREAADTGVAVQLKVADANDPSLRLYSRLGFAPADDLEFYTTMEWKAVRQP